MITRVYRDTEEVEVRLEADRPGWEYERTLRLSDVEFEYGVVLTQRGFGEYVDIWGRGSEYGGLIDTYEGYMESFYERIWGTPLPVYDGKQVNQYRGEHYRCKRKRVNHDEVQHLIC